nr:MAG TPA: hypothetical protein [Caudoviricetes sp.]
MRRRSAIACLFNLPPPIFFVHVSCLVLIYTYCAHMSSTICAFFCLL